MKLENLRALRGPNLWSDLTSLEALVAPQANLGASARVLSPETLGWLPRELSAVLLDRASARAAAAFWPETLALLAVAVQSAVDSPVNFSRVVGSADGQRVVVEYQEEEIGRQALQLALEIVTAIEDGLTLEVAPRLTQIREHNHAIRLGPSTGDIVRAAISRGIPARRLTEGSLVQLGYGSRACRIWAAETDRTSAIAESIAQDKELTKALLAAVGIPVPCGMPAASAEEAFRAAETIGLPVVVKPRKGNQGKGVSVCLKTRASIELAYGIAAERGEVIVERHVEGADFRLLVVGARLIAAARREVPQVVGDGVSCIADLVRVENLNPLRGDDHSTALSKLKLDEIGLGILREQGLTAESVPARGARVALRRNANLSTGGTAADVTDTVHPDVARRAVEAARMVGLDIAGIDIVASSIEVPLEQSGGAIVEVNAAPGLRMHIEPSSGQGRAVGAAIIDATFAPGDQARVPVVAVTGTNGKTTTTRCIAHLLRQNGQRVGMTCTDGIYVEGRRIDTGDCSGPKSARIVLSHPRVDAAVLETARGGMLREGLGFDLCDVAVVTNVAEGDHLGMGGVNTPEELARIKAIPVRRVAETGSAVLNADDPLVVTMAAECRGSVVFFSRRADSKVIRQHLARGGRAVTVRDGFIVLARGADERRVARVAELPLTHGGRIGFQVDNLLAAVAAGSSLGLSVETLRFGLETFSSEVGVAPGRFNVIKHKDSTIILDYGHNASALLALTEAIKAMPHRQRKIVYTAAGDRRDEDIRRQAEIIAAFFHEVYIYEDQCTRGRPDGEVLRLMSEGIARAKSSCRVRRASSELTAIAAAISNLSAGDLLLCQVDQVDLSLEFVSTLFRQAETARSTTSLAQFASAALAAFGIVG